MRAYRCLAEGREDGWTAICVDLDIAVQGHTYDGVPAGIEKAVSLYLEDVAEMPQDEQRRFLNRRAPWYLRAKYNSRALATKLRLGNGHREFSLSPQAIA